MSIELLTPSGVIAKHLAVISYTPIVGEKKLKVKAGAFFDDSIESKEENALQIFEFQFFADDFPENSVQQITEATIEITKKVATMPEFTK